MGFEGSGGGIILDKQVSVGQLGTDELFDFMVERKLARKEVFHLVDPKLGHDQAISKVDAKLIPAPTTARMLIESALQILEGHPNIDPLGSLINQIYPGLPLRDLPIRPIRKGMNRLPIQLVPKFFEVRHCKHAIPFEKFSLLFPAR